MSYLTFLKNLTDNNINIDQFFIEMHKTILSVFCFFMVWFIFNIFAIFTWESFEYIWISHTVFVIASLASLTYSYFQDKHYIKIGGSKSTYFKILLKMGGRFYLKGYCIRDMNALLSGDYLKLLTSKNSFEELYNAFQKYTLDFHTNIENILFKAIRIKITKGFENLDYQELKIIDDLLHHKKDPSCCFYNDFSFSLDRFQNKLSERLKLLHQISIQSKINNFS